MKILYVGMKYDYGKPEQGLSFEHCNMFDCLHHMGHDIIYFDYMTLMQKQGSTWMNRRLAEVVKAEKPDLMFTVLFMDELDRKIVKTISESGDTTTFNWFCDDHFRFDSYSSSWAKCFNWVSTTALSALPKYAAIGYQNVIKTQWACNPFLYREMDLTQKYDVTFVGQPHGNRREVISKLQQAGIDVKVWGRGWDTDRASQDGMIRIFNQSKINLNLTNSYIPISSPSMSTQNSLPRTISRTMNSTLLGRQIKSFAKRVFTISKANEERGMEETHCNQYVEQIKGRNFEVPGCGGFLLTGDADNLNDYYQENIEIAIFRSPNELVEKAHYFLEHEDERKAIATAGHRRTMSEHTYVHRFHDIFNRIGLPSAPITGILECHVEPGTVVNIAS